MAGDVLAVTMWILKFLIDLAMILTENSPVEISFSSLTI
jgi:hypothetical protein